MDLVAEPGSILQGRRPCGLVRSQSVSERSHHRSCSPGTIMATPANRRPRGIEPDLGRYVDSCWRILSRGGRQLLGTCLTQSFYLPQPMSKQVRRSAGSEKNVKIVGTNSISHLESTEVAKNELKMNSKRGRKRAVKTRNEAKRTPILTPEWGPAVQPENGAPPRHGGRVWE